MNSNTNSNSNSDETTDEADVKHPQMLDDFGEDPYYYLNSSAMQAQIRIRMIDDKYLLRAYRGIENRYFDGRPGVLREIDTRLEELEAMEEMEKTDNGQDEQQDH